MRGTSKVIPNKRCTCKLVVVLSTYVIVLWYAHVHSLVCSKYGSARSGTLEFHEFQNRAGWSATAELSYASPARSSDRSLRVQPKQCRRCLAHLPDRHPESILYRKWIRTSLPCVQLGAKRAMRARIGIAELWRLTCTYHSSHQHANPV